MNRFIRFLPSYLIAWMSILAPGGGRAQPQEITREEARQLVLTALQSEGFDVKSPNLVVEDQPDDREMPGFYMFSAYTVGQGMNLSAGAYAVGRRTVEIWNWMHCWRFTRARRLRSLQKRLRNEIGLTELEYRRLSAARPFCFSAPVSDH